MLKSKTSTILAATALVVAVFGSTPLGHAAVSIVLPKGSVGTYQLKRGAVTSLKVKNYSLVAADFKAGQLPTGPQGRGRHRRSGRQRLPDRLRKLYLLVGQTGIVTATCPVGKKAMGGGVGSMRGWRSSSQSRPTEDRGGSVGGEPQR